MAMPMGNWVTGYWELPSRHMCAKHKQQIVGAMHEKRSDFRGGMAFTMTAAWKYV